jgi:pyruvate/2-oxoglutarate dehydrogenase complex dihydrolipoamide acyltransferase (E2) component
MNQNQSGFTLLPFPAERRAVVDAGRMGVGRPVINGLLEIDITRAREIFRAHKARTGEGLSFTAFIVACLGHAVDQNRRVQAYRDLLGRLVVFDEVDVVTLVEPAAGRVAIPHIIRAANRKSFREIHAEIRQVQARPEGSAQRGPLARLGVYAPSFARRLFYWAMRHNPHWMKRLGGTVVVTSVGMFGQGSGWGIGFLPMHTLGLTVGGIAEKPGVVEGRIEIREYLCLTVSFDHDLVDGAPGARFANRLKELLEGAYGLEE